VDSATEFRRPGPTRCRGRSYSTAAVGVSKAGARPELRRAIDRAREFDRKIVVEEAVPDAREIECAVLGNDAPEGWEGVRGGGARKRGGTRTKRSADS